jgi:hypothetical protein
VERQQLRWLLVAAAVTVLAVQALTGNQVDLGWLVGLFGGPAPWDRVGDPALSAV